LIFADNTQTLAGLADNAGVLASDWRAEGQWGVRGASLSAYAGKAVSSYVLYANQSTTYYASDHLGSARILTVAGGWPVASDAFYPFGAEQTPPPGDNAYKFATLDRDAESQQDHTSFRQYAYIEGRWTTPDPYDGSYDITNPQSLNRYAYVLNNPLSYSDPLGLDDPTGGGGGCDPTSDPNCNPNQGGGGGSPGVRERMLRPEWKHIRTIRQRNWMGA
jgi:RHS repeat-associated protein